MDITVSFLSEKSKIMDISTKSKVIFVTNVIVFFSSLIVISSISKPYFLLPNVDLQSAIVSIVWFHFSFVNTYVNTMSVYLCIVIVYSAMFPWSDQWTNVHTNLLNWYFFKYVDIENFSYICTLIISKKFINSRGAFSYHLVSVIPILVYLVHNLLPR